MPETIQIIGRVKLLLFIEKRTLLENGVQMALYLVKERKVNVIIDVV